MTYEGFNAFCGGLPAAVFVEQWGGSQVWKVGDKVFAIGGWEADDPAFTFKVTPLGFAVLRDLPGLRPAPYLASRGMSWVQHYAAPGLSDAELRVHLRGSYELVVAGLTRKVRAELGV